MLSGNDTLYRVSLDPDKNTVHVSCIGMERVDNTLADTYLSVDDLPQWVQEKLALLMMTDPSPPTSEVKGVGRRIDKHTFWVCEEREKNEWSNNRKD
jgi:hypothetical protein